MMATVAEALIAHFRPWEFLPPADWVDPAHCVHPGPYTAYRPDVWHCNPCGHPLMRAEISGIANRSVILPGARPTT